MSLNEFNHISFEAWKNQAIKDLKGASYDEKLKWCSIHDISGEAYYNVENSPCVAVPNWNIDSKWNIAESFTVNDEVQANKAIHKALQNGIEKINLNIKKTKIDFDKLLDEVLLPYIFIEINATENVIEICNDFIQYVKQKSYNTTTLNGSFAYDPLHYCVSNGDFHITTPFVEAEQLVTVLDKNLPNFTSIAVKGNYYGECGANAVQELAFTLAHFHEYIHRLSDLGLDVEKIARKTAFYVSIGDDFFIQIAKIKALRYLVEELMQAYSANKVSMPVHAVCNINLLSYFDEYNNLLRLTIQAMSAVLGAVNSCELPQFSLRNKDGFTQRISTNIQHILREESYLEAGMNAGEGSFYIDYLTNQLIEKSWEKFVEIEQNNGFLYVLKNGIIQDTITVQAEKVKALYNENQKIALGVNKFLNDKDVKADIEVCENIIEGAFCKTLKPFRPFAELEIKRNFSI